MDAENHEAHEQQLAAALRDLLEQIDLSQYRDELGHKLENNAAVLKAQGVVDRFDLTHEQLCDTLDECLRNGDFAAAAQRLFAARTAIPRDTPPEYRTWQTGP